MFSHDIEGLAPCDHQIPESHRTHLGEAVVADAVGEQLLHAVQQVVPVARQLPAQLRVVRRYPQRARLHRGAQSLRGRALGLVNTLSDSQGSGLS